MGPAYISYSRLYMEAETIEGGQSKKTRVRHKMEEVLAPSRISVINFIVLTLMMAQNERNQEVFKLILRSTEKISTFNLRSSRFQILKRI